MIYITICFTSTITIAKMQKQEHVLMEQIDQMLKKYSPKEAQADQQYIKSLPQELIEFLKEKQIDVKELAIPIPRYIRVKPGSKIQVKNLVQSLKIQQDQLIKVDEEFYALDPSVKINNSECYQEGLIYGMDYSSCIPIRCLQAQENQRVLELCSAPGNKSMYLVDSLQNVKIVGVQISINRANVMKNLIKKYKLQDKIQVKVEDGVTFDSQQLFDRVLIDAQCTHEGSIKHIKKFIPETNKTINNKQQIKKKKNLTKQQQRQYQLNNSNPYTTDIKKANQWSIQDFKQRFLDQKKLNNLQKLQFGLLQNGFRLLKDNGILVYSTCSFDTSQNQDIVIKFIQNYKNAQLMDCKKNLKCAVGYEEGNIKETLRFSPSISRCGGMFICKIRKNTQVQKIKQ